MPNSIFKNDVLMTVIKSSYVNWVLITEGRASRAGTNSGGVASLCLDHRHGPSQKSLHTPDGRRSTYIFFFFTVAVSLIADLYQNMLVFYIVTRLIVSTKFSCSTMTHVQYTRC